MSHVKTNKISPRKGTTTTIGDSGDSVTISSGTTTTNAGTISTAGITGGTINNTTGSITGLQQQVSWQTGSIKTANFTASANEGYFLNTTSGQITVTLPASPTAGDVVAVKDYADTFDTNKAILNANGNKIQGSTTNFDITVEGTAAILLYVDSTKGWLLVDQSKAADISEDIRYVTATGGTITTSGDYKIHTFTGPGTFCVSCGGNPAGNDKIDYMVVAGGGSGGGFNAGGGGAGGFRESRNPDNAPAWTASPLASTTSLTLPATAYPVTVGAGGSTAGDNRGNSGSNSVLSTITSAGGGGGGKQNSGLSGGSGGGGSSGPNCGSNPGGSGNTPPVSPPQGNNGGLGYHKAGLHQSGGGGGGAGAVGSNASTGPAGQGGNGGNGVTTSINASPVTRAGGGGGASDDSPGTSGGSGGSGGGGNGSFHPAPSNPSTAGTANTGGGGGGGAGTGAAGGSGIVIIRYKFQ